MLYLVVGIAYIVAGLAAIAAVLSVGGIPFWVPFLVGVTSGVCIGQGWVYITSQVR